MIRYNRNNTCVARPLNFSGIDWSPIHIKNIREDFMDMFSAEHKMRCENGDLSCVFVLTYNNEHLTHKYGRNLLNSDDLKIFAKSSRFCKSLLRNFGYIFDFVCVGEYGSDGKRHTKKSTRGLGNNPHYHCVGWFHKLPDFNKPIDTYILDYLGINSYDPKVFLPLLVRYEWQKSLHNDIDLYAKYYTDDSKGFVQLGGEVLSGNRGSSYISKYIGKDIKKLFLSTYFKGFIPSVVSSLEKCLFDELSGNGVAPDVALDLDSIRAIIRYFCYNSDCQWLYLLKDSRSFVNDFPIAIPSEVTANALLFRTLLVKMACCYEDHFRDFYSDINGKHSPKVRKFHQFGYSLINRADLNKGTYTILKKQKYIERNLPPSLIRHFYYNHYVCCSLKQKDVVLYEPNANGKLLICYKCAQQCQKDLDIIKCHGSYNLQMYSLEVVNFKNYLSYYDFDCRCFNKSNFDLLLRDYKICEDILLSCKCLDCDFLLPANHVYIDVHDFLKNKYPHIYAGYLELLELNNKQLAHSAENAREFNAHWENLYMSNY